jgi:hypothetical protein
MAVARCLDGGLMLVAATMMVGILRQTGLLIVFIAIGIAWATTLVGLAFLILRGYRWFSTAAERARTKAYEGVFGCPRE